METPVRAPEGVNTSKCSTFAAVVAVVGAVGFVEGVASALLAFATEDISKDAAVTYSCSERKQTKMSATLVRDNAMVRICVKTPWSP